MVAPSLVKGSRGRLAIPKVGHFYRSIDGQVFILAQVDAGKVGLISLRDGNRWHAPVQVGNVNRLSKEEWEVVCDGEKFFRQ